MENNPLLIDVQATCQILSISRASYFSMKAAGRIAPQEIRLGKKILLRADEVRDWALAGCPPRRLWQWKARAGRC